MTYDLMLNMAKSGIKPRIKVSQYDNEIPQLRITLFDQNQSYSIPSGATVYISGTKKDNTGFQYECTVNDNIITAPITNQMTVFSGDVECEINIVTVGGQKSSENFILEVEKSALQDDVVISETDLPIIEQLPQMIQEMKEEVELAHNWANYGDESEEPSANNNSKHWSDVSGDNAELSHQWATYGSSSETPSATNNAKYWSGVAQQYAQGGLHYSGSVTFANIPTSGMNVGDMYNIEDDFTTDSRFQEGSGISVKAGSNIAWNPNDKWDVLALGGGGGTSDYSDLTNKPQINGVTLSGNKTASELGVKVNDNLLANGHFNINTKGFTSGTVANYFWQGTIDGWYPSYGDGNDSLGMITHNSDNTITLMPNYTTDHTGAMSIQTRDNSITKLFGKTVCLSAIINDTELLQFSGVFRENEWFSHTFDIGNNTRVSMSLHNMESSPVNYGFDIGVQRIDNTQEGVTSVKINDVKLELGDHSTLLQELEPNDNLELVKCGGGATKQDITSIVATGTTNNTGDTITNGQLFYLNDTLCKALSNIASGSAFTLNTNYKVDSLNDELINKVNIVHSKYVATAKTVTLPIGSNLAFVVTSHGTGNVKLYLVVNFNPSYVECILIKENGTLAPSITGNNGNVTSSLNEYDTIQIIPLVGGNDIRI